MSAITCKLETPVKCAEEGKQDSAVGRLDAQRLVEQGNRHSRVHVRDQTCTTSTSRNSRNTSLYALTLSSNAGLASKVNSGAGSTKVRKTSCKTEHHIWLGYSMRDSVCHAELAYKDSRQQITQQDSLDVRRSAGSARHCRRRRSLRLWLWQGQQRTAQLPRGCSARRDRRFETRAAPTQCLRRRER